MSQVKVTADSGGGTVSLKAPASTTSNAAVVLTLPVDDGAANTFLKSNGSGVTSFAAPTATEIGTTSGTASADTFLCGNNTWAEAGGGKILQVKSTTKTDTTSVASASSFADISGMSVTLTTPTSGTKVLVRFHIQISGTANMYGAVKILRDSTDIGIGDAISGFTRASAMVTDTSVSYGTYKMWTVANEFYDTHGADGSTDVTYKLQWRETTGASRTIWLNRTSDSANGDSNIATVSTITAMEVSA